MHDLYDQIVDTLHSLRFLLKRIRSSQEFGQILSPKMRLGSISKTCVWEMRLDRPMVREAMVNSGVRCLALLNHAQNTSHMEVS
jgi:hypothetical protein